MGSMTVEEILESYFLAWNGEDVETRRSHLMRCVTDDAVYRDPTAEVFGPDALADHIEKTRRAFGGFSIQRTSGFEQHHAHGRFAWQMRLEDGGVLVEGFDVVRLAADNRLESIIGFFGPFPEP